MRRRLATIAVAIAVAAIAIDRSPDEDALPPLPRLAPARLERTARARAGGDEDGTLVVSAGGVHTPAWLVGSPADVVVRGVIQNHSDEDNPRNRNEPAYVAKPAELLHPGQVGVMAAGPKRVRFTQWVQARSRAPRTFSVAID